LALRARQAWPDVIVVENHHPRGLSGARNSGVSATRSEIIAFLDDDAAATPEWLARLNDQYRDPDVLGVGGSIEPVWQTERPAWFPAEFDWVVGCTYRGLPETVHAVRNLIGCNMSFRREVFQKAGGFRSEIGRIGTRPVGCEETEFCIRVNQHQPRGVFVHAPSARVYHQVPSQRTNMRYFIARCYAEGLSKAFVTRLVGSGQSLASERTYAFQTLPRGVRRNLADMLRRRDLAGLARAMAIVAGLGVTTWGYVWTALGLRFTSKRPIINPRIISSE
jgi:glycosyltransferase involved in cell wall biosynthesis